MTALFSDAYLKFTHLYNQLQVREEDNTIRVPEKVIRCIWNDQLFCTPSLKTREGQGLMQVYQDFCTQNQNNCLHCPFPDVVKKYFS